MLAAGDAGLRNYICSVFKLLQALGNAQLLRDTGLRNSIRSVPNAQQALALGDVRLRSYPTVTANTSGEQLVDAVASAGAGERGAAYFHSQLSQVAAGAGAG